MFQVLDTFFTKDITDLILGHLNDDYLVDPKNKDRIFHRKDWFGSLVPKEAFRHAVWNRRYRNSYCREGVKLEAYNHLPLPKNRLPYILCRSFSKFHRSIPINCSCDNPFPGTYHILHHLIENTLDYADTVDLVEFYRSGIYLSVPFMFQYIGRECYQEDFDDIYPYWVKSEPLFRWEDAEKIYKSVKPYIAMNLIWKFVYFCKYQGL